jgi:four helix bundle protein
MSLNFLFRTFRGNKNFKLIGEKMNSLQNFKSYQLAKALYQECQASKLSGTGLRDQLLRAASSVALNLAEGSAKRSPKDRARFYEIALASLREVQAILDLKQISRLQQQADTLGAHVYSLLRATRNTIL